MEQDKHCNELDASSSFYFLLNQIFGQEDINRHNFLSKIKNYMNNKEARLEKKIYELLLYLNPITDNFNSEVNKNYIFNILNYLNNHKKESLEAKKLLELFTKIFEKETFCKIFFNNNDNLFGQESLYLEMLILFFPEKKIEKILDVMKSYLTEEDKTNTIIYLEKIFSNLDLQKIESFYFLKKILLKFLENRNNIINSIKELQNEYLTNSKNYMLRCPICYNLPIFSITQEKLLNIYYSCGHKKSEINDKCLEEIFEYKFICSLCNEKLLDVNKNYLCSNCKMLLCPNCTSEHFKNCITLFFISLNDIGLICCEHKEKYENYCIVCNLNLCHKCSIEHCHIVEKDNINFLTKENMKKINDILSTDKKNKKLILQSIKIIISSKIFKNNFQFLFFIKNLLGIKIKKESAMFEEFYGEKFKAYYKYIISQVNKGSLYYLEVLNKIANEYKNNNLKINDNYNNFSSSIVLILELKKQIRIMNSNQIIYSLLTKYFEKINYIKFKLDYLDLENKIDLININLQETQIIIQSVLKSEYFYQNKLLKLINRSIADSLIRFLIEKFPNNFKKIYFNFSIFENLNEIYKNTPQKLEKIENDNKGAIINYMDNLKYKINNEEKENTINDLKLVFINPIKIKGDLLSVDKLNLMLEYLFLIKEKGNLITHPNSKNNTHLNEISYNSDLSKDKYSEVEKEKEKEKLKEYLYKYFINKNFKNKVKAYKLFDCLFNGKFHDLIFITEEKSEIVNQFFSEIIINDYEEDLKKKLENFSESLAQLEDIIKSLDNISLNIIEKPNLILKEFFYRLNNAIQDEKTVINFLSNIANFKYENSITGENYLFISECFNNIIKNILKNSKKIINGFEETKKKIINNFKIQKSINDMLDQLREKLKNFIPFNEQKFNINDLIEFINNGKNENEKITVKENITIGELQEDFKKLIDNTDIDWTIYNKLSLLTFLYLKQNNY